MAGPDAASYGVDCMNKESKRAYDRKRYLANRESKIESARKWYRAHLAERRAYVRKWRAANLEKARESSRKWAAAHPEMWREAARKRAASDPERVREYSRKWAVAHPETKRAAARKWAAAHPDKVREYSRKRRALKNGCVSRDSGLIDRLIAESDGCAYCSKGWIFERPTVDHVVPLSSGGQHSPENVAPCCPACNSRKGTKPLLPWLRNTYGSAGLRRYRQWVAWRDQWLAKRRAA